MVSSDATTPDAYLASLPPERCQALTALRDVILTNLPAGYEEGMQYGMIGYFVPLERFSDTYNGQPLWLAGLASQKHYMCPLPSTRRSAARSHRRDDRPRAP